MYLRNRVLYPLDETFRQISMLRIASLDRFQIKSPMLIALLLLALSWFVLRRTNIGRRLYFTGANPVAARFSGIDTDRVKIGVYVASSVFAAFAGLMYVARLNACEPGLGMRYKPMDYCKKRVKIHQFGGSKSVAKWKQN